MAYEYQYGHEDAGGRTWPHASRYDHSTHVRVYDSEAKLVGPWRPIGQEWDDEEPTESEDKNMNDKMPLPPGHDHRPSGYNVQVVLDFLLHHMSMETRCALRAAHPLAYDDVVVGRRTF